jgi:hypothetical protein
MDLLTAHLAWKSICVVLLVFGFAPGAVIRILAKCWPPGHPRRAELHAELRAIDYWKRPIWVVE